MKNKNKFFEKFHKKFKGDTYEKCSTCGGCEFSLIATLLPKEAEYMAYKLDINYSDFKEQFLDEIIVDNKSVEVIKMINPCSWLIDYKCTVKDFKPILCEIYPLVLYIKNNKIKTKIDKWCPLSKDEETVESFKRKWKKVKKLIIKNIDPEFVTLIDKYEDGNYNVDDLEKERNTPTSKCAKLNCDCITKHKIKIEALNTLKEFDKSKI